MSFSYYIEVLDSLGIVDIYVGSAVGKQNDYCSSGASEDIAGLVDESTVNINDTTTVHLPASVLINSKVRQTKQSIRELPSTYWSELIDCWVCHPEEDNINVNTDLLHIFEPEIGQEILVDDSKASSKTSGDSLDTMQIWIGETYILVPTSYLQPLPTHEVHLAEKSQGWNAEIQAGSSHAGGMDAFEKCAKVLFTKAGDGEFQSRANKSLEDDTTELLSLLEDDCNKLVLLLTQNSRFIPPQLRAMAGLTRSFLQM
ncbi:hypothetical protein IW138_001013 [Coemansia sp. RSA 986]|nr:hypothetical protein IW138_001013 [Coemansia sp. RSA 986]